MSGMSERQGGTFLPAHGGAAANCEAQAHRLYFEQYQWAPALRLWELRARLGPPTLESQFALAHCRIVNDVDAGLPTLGLAEPATASDGRIAGYAELARMCAWGYANGGDGAHAARLTRLVTAVDPHLRSVYEEQILRPGQAGALPAPSRDPDPLPFEREPLSDAEAVRLLERHRDTRVLLLMRTVDYARADMEATLCRVLRVSVEQLGLPVAVLESHALDPAGCAALAGRLRETIAAFRPTVIVCGEPLVSGAVMVPEVAADVFAELAAARRQGCKVVGSYWDAWYDGMPGFFTAMLEHLDAIHVIFPGLLRRVSPAVAARTFCYPFPWHDPRPTEARGAPQRLRGSFAGTRTWANQSRAAWCAEIVRAGLPVDLQLAAPDKPRSAAAYAEALAGYAVTVNLTARSSGDRVFTLRTVEAPWFGSLLLEEDSDDTRYFMRPFEHYVPFATFDELAGRLDILLNDEPRRLRIARAGTAWVHDKFGARPFWARLLRQLHGDGPASPPPASSIPTPPITVPTVALDVPHSAATYAAFARPLVPLDAR